MWIEQNANSLESLRYIKKNFSLTGRIPGGLHIPFLLTSIAVGKTFWEVFLGHFVFSDTSIRTSCKK